VFKSTRSYTESTLRNNTRKLVARETTAKSNTLQELLNITGKNSTRLEHLHHLNTYQTRSFFTTLSTKERKKEKSVDDNYTALQTYSNIFVCYFLSKDPKKYLLLDLFPDSVDYDILLLLVIVSKLLLVIAINRLLATSFSLSYEA